MVCCRPPFPHLRWAGPHLLPLAAPTRASVALLCYPCCVRGQIRTHLRVSVTTLLLKPKLATARRIVPIAVTYVCCSLSCLTVLERYVSRSDRALTFSHAQRTAGDRRRRLGDAPPSSSGTALPLLLLDVFYCSRSVPVRRRGVDTHLGQEPCQSLFYERPLPQHVGATAGLARLARLLLSAHRLYMQSREISKRGGGQYGRKTHLGRSRAMTARRKSPQGVLQASARAMAANRSARRRSDDPVTCRGPRGVCLPSPIPPSLLLTCCLLRPPAFGRHSSFHAHSLCPSYPAPYLHPLPPARVRDLLS